MGVVFFHDTKITVKDKVLYSAGGLNKNIIERYLSLSKEFCLVTREDNSRDLRNLSELGSSDEISFTSIPNLASINIINFRRALKTISKIIEENDFMIIRLPSIIGLVAVYFAKKNKKNYIIELVGCPWDSYRLHSVKGKIMAGPMFFLTKYFVNNAKSILYVTDFFLQKRYPTDSQKQIGCSDVELIIDKNVLGKRYSRINELKKGSTKIKLGMIGFVEARYKGFDTAIKALGVLKSLGYDNYILEIVGGGNPAYIKKLARDNNLNEQINIIGTLSHPKGVFDWLDTIDIYLQPSRTEGLPRALIEAMSRACACVGSDAGEIPQLIESTFIHKKNDYKNLVRLILNLRKVGEMKKNSKSNYYKVHKYDKKLLDNKRHNFYKESIEF